MKKINILVLKSFFGPLILTLCISEFIFILQFVWKYIDDFVGKEINLGVILEQIGYQAVTFVPLVLPISILLSSIMTFGNMGEHYELVAMKASGISLGKVMKPLIIFSVFLCFIALYFSNNIIPIAQLKARTLLYDIQQTKLTLSIKEGVFYNDIDNMVIKVNKKGEDGKTLYDIIIYDHSSPGGYSKVITAKSGILKLIPEHKQLAITLFDGYMYDEVPFSPEDRNKLPLKKIYFKEYTQTKTQKGFDLERSGEDLFSHRAEMMNVNQIGHTIDSLDLDITKFETNLSSFVNEKMEFININQKADSLSCIKLNSILDSLTQTDKVNILNYAANRIKFIRDEVDYTKKMVSMRETNINYCEIELNRKFILSVACLVFFFIGAPLGAIIRRGGLGLPVVISCFLFVIYHVISFTLEKNVKAGIISAWVGMWLPTFIFLPFGVYLTYIAATDSPLMDLESWEKSIFKIKNKLKRK